MFYFPTFWKISSRGVFFAFFLSLIKKVFALGAQVCAVGDLSLAAVAANGRSEDVKP